MPVKTVVHLNKFNRGVISPLAFARTGLERVKDAAEEQTNWMPRVLGSMSLRPGLKFLCSSKDDAPARHIPFVFSTSDKAILEMTNLAMRVYIDDQICIRPSVSSSVTNSSFASDVTGWTDSDEAGATSSWNASGYLSLVGTGFSSAVREQEVTVSGGDQGTEHALRIIIPRGVCSLKIGSTAGEDDYFSATLTEGEHSLAFTPTGNFHIYISSLTQYATLIDSITVESAGPMQVAAPWLTDDLDELRHDQSADVVFIAANGYRQYKVERRTPTSWSVVKDLAEDGPFRSINTSTTSIAASATTGDITLTASQSIFKSTNVGSLYRISSIGQTVGLSVTAEAQWSDPIRVTGIENNRIFTIDISGTWTATVTLQKSVGEVGNWSDVVEYTTNQSALDYDDGLDNEIIYYRIGVDTGDFTSGTAVSSLTFVSGSLDGVVRISGYSSTTSVTAIVLKALGGTAASSVWSEGLWSDRRGFPSSVVLHEGRLISAGKDRIVGSISDDFSGHDDTVIGDSAPFIRTIGSGPVDTINWMLPLKNLAVGGQGAEFIIKATTLDEPLTATNFNIKNPSTQGSADVAAVKIDNFGFYVQRSKRAVYELHYSINDDDFTSADVSTLSPEILGPGIVKLAVQRQPDTRVHALRSDGKVALHLFDPGEETRSWILIETDGLVEDVFVMPGIEEEDEVYYLVNRTINGDTKRYLEKWAFESETDGGTLNKQLDSYALYSRTATTAVTGLEHLEGEVVHVWGDGKYLDSYTVSSGSITLSEAAAELVVGLTYRARYKSTKLADGASIDYKGKTVPITGLNQVKRIDRVGFILRNTHKDGITYGDSCDSLDPLPEIEEGAPVPDDTIHANYDKNMIGFDGGFETDPRFYMEANAPKPATVLSVTLSVKTNEKP